MKIKFKCEGHEWGETKWGRKACIHCCKSATLQQINGWRKAADTKRILSLVRKAGPLGLTPKGDGNR